MGCRMEAGGALSSWFATWSADVITTSRIRENGRTSFEMTTNHRCGHVVVGFGEKVFFQHSKHKNHDYRKENGVFLGVNDRNNTYLVGTPEGIYASPQVVRMLDDSAYDMVLLEQIKVRYYNSISEGVQQPSAIVADRSVGGVPRADPNPVVPSG